MKNTESREVKRYEQRIEQFRQNMIVDLYQKDLCRIKQE